MKYLLLCLWEPPFNAISHYLIGPKVGEGSDPHQIANPVRILEIINQRGGISNEVSYDLYISEADVLTVPKESVKYHRILDEKKDQVLIQNYNSAISAGKLAQAGLVSPNQNPPPANPNLRRA